MQMFMFRQPVVGMLMEPGAAGMDMGMGMSVGMLMAMRKCSMQMFMGMGMFMLMGVLQGNGIPDGQNRTGNHQSHCSPEP